MRLESLVKVGNGFALVKDRRSADLVRVVGLLTINPWVGSGAAWADSSDIPEVLLEDFRINELTYADAASTSCEYESILTGPNAEPSDRSFQLV